MQKYAISLFGIGIIVLQFIESARELVDKLTAAVSLRRVLGRKDISGVAMDPDAERCGILGFVAPCHESADKTSQDIPAAALGHAGVAACVDKALPAGAEDTGVVALHHNMAAGLCAELPGEDFPFAIVLAGEEPFQLSLVGR